MARYAKTATKGPNLERDAMYRLIRTFAKIVKKPLYLTADSGTFTDGSRINVSTGDGAYARCEHEISHILFNSNFYAYGKFPAAYIGQLNAGMAKAKLPWNSSSSAFLMEAVKTSLNILDDHRVNGLWGSLYYGSYLELRDLSRRKLIRDDQRETKDIVADAVNVLLLRSVGISVSERYPETGHVLKPIADKALEMVRGRGFGAVLYSVRWFFGMVIRAAAYLRKNPEPQPPPPPLPSGDSGSESKGSNSDNGDPTPDDSTPEDKDSDSGAEGGGSDGKKPSSEESEDSEDNGSEDSASGGSGASDDSEDTDGAGGDDSDDRDADGFGVPMEMEDKYSGNDLNFEDLDKAMNELPLVDRLKMLAEVTAGANVEALPEAFSTPGTILDKYVKAADRAAAEESIRNILAMKRDEATEKEFLDSERAAQEEKLDALRNALEAPKTNKTGYDEDTGSKFNFIRCKSTSAESPTEVLRADYGDDAVASALKIRRMFERLYAKKTMRLEEDGLDLDVPAFIHRKLNKTDEPIFKHETSGRGFHLMVLLDQSGSMTSRPEVKKIGMMLQTALDLPYTSFEIASFTQTNNPDLGVTDIVEYDKGDALRQFTPVGGTPLHAALGWSVRKLRKMSGNRLLLVVTDGDPNFVSLKARPWTLATCVMKSREAVHSAQRNGISVAAVGLVNLDTTFRKIFGSQSNWKIATKASDAEDAILGTVQSAYRKFIKTV